MNKGVILNFIRKAGLMPLADRLRFCMEKFKNRKIINREFLEKHQEIKLPPDYLLYESFQLNYKKYNSDSVETAQWLAGLLKKHILQTLKFSTGVADPAGSSVIFTNLPVTDVSFIVPIITANPFNGVRKTCQGYGWLPQDVWIIKKLEK